MEQQLVNIQSIALQQNRIYNPSHVTNFYSGWPLRDKLSLPLLATYATTYNSWLWRTQYLGISKTIATDAQSPNIKRRKKKSKNQEFNAYSRCALVIHTTPLANHPAWKVCEKDTKNVEEKLNINNKGGIPFEKQNTANATIRESEEIGTSTCPRKADSIKIVILFIMAFGLSLTFIHNVLLPELTQPVFHTPTNTTFILCMSLSKIGWQ